jgi:16S rRNA processing protein RimM
MLVGFTVIDFNNNKKIGKIAYIDEQTINTMFELTDGTLIPASEELIEDVDIDGKTVTINIPEGLL